MPKKMIFHIPMQLNPNHASGSHIRPFKMIEAFKSIGYEVDVVMGYAKQRKEQILKIKQEIEDGVRYEFLYSESSTMPTALTQRNHLPTSPFLDFNFFGFCKRNGIKIGLFYRDIHWVFEASQQGSSCKKFIAKLFYKSDLKNYKKYLDILYLPSVKMFEYIPMFFDKQIAALPPAIEPKDNVVIKKNEKQQLNFIYVGGLGKIYNLQLFSHVLNSFNKMSFALCTRESEWNENKDKYANLESLNVHHQRGKSLESIYKTSDIAILFIEPLEYWKFAMAVKLFEYLAYKKPIITVKGTAVGKFVEVHNLGWVINYDEQELKNLLLHLKKNPSEIEEKITNIENITEDNTWNARAYQVEKDLSS